MGKATKNATFALVALLIITLTGCQLLFPQPEADFEITSWEQTHYTLTASFEIIDWEQPFYSSLGEYGLVRLNYKITNTGTLAIRYYKVWFEVQCADGTTFKEWTNGVDVRRWDYETSATYVDTGGRRAVSVSLSDYELEPPISQEPKTLVRIDYRITNTGPVSIDYYEVWFEVRCADGTTFKDWTNGFPIPKGQSRTDFTFVTAWPSSEVVSVSVLEYELTHHSILVLRGASGGAACPSRASSSPVVVRSPSEAGAASRAGPLETILGASQSIDGGVTPRRQPLHRARS